MGQSTCGFRLALVLGALGGVRGLGCSANDLLFDATAAGAGPGVGAPTPRQAERKTDSRYHLARDGVALVGHNPAQGFTMRVDAHGFEVRESHDVWHARFETRALRCGDERVSIAPGELGEVTAEPQRASNARSAGIEEWAVNGPLGVEHGYALVTDPCEGNTDEIVVELRVDGLAASASAHAVLLRDEAGVVRARYADLSATDASGARLAAELGATASAIELRVRVAGATFPVAIDPFVSAQVAKLTASDGATGDYFGGNSTVQSWVVSSVALSGTTALVGAAGHDVGASTQQGAAYVYVQSGSTWPQQSKLAAADGGADDWFGSVAVSGTTALVGAPNKTLGTQYQMGAGYVFVQAGANWTEQAKLTASDGGGNDWFGHSVAVNGATVLVGAYAKDVGTQTSQGAAYAFVRSGTTWIQQAKLTASDGDRNDFFGSSVSVSGTTAIVGATGDTFTSDHGAAYVFVRSGTIWTEQAKLAASDGAGSEFFGYTVAVSGATAIIGAPYSDIGVNSNQGAAYVFVQNGTTWTEQAKLTASDGAALSQFGNSVALTGTMALVGAPNMKVGTNGYQGAGYVFVQSGTNWTQQARLTASDGAASDHFGNSVAASGTTALVGAPDRAVGTNTNQGAAYVFSITGSNTQGDPCSPVGACTPPYTCVDGVCCNSECTGSCMACVQAYTGQLDGTCAPVVAGADPDRACKDDGTTTCEQDGFCDGAGACEQYAQSSGCASNGCTTTSDCTSGFCVDDVCCDTACTGPCAACSQAKKGSGLDGVCDTIADGTDPDAECTAQMGSGTCASSGFCSGSGTCRAKSLDTPCAQPTCSADGVTLNTPKCDGTGNCPITGLLSDCTPFACIGFACRATCATALDCAPGYHCDAGQCRAPSADGVACYKDADCASGNCVDGVCCHTACTGTCEWCGDPVYPGQCAVVTGAPHGEGKSCGGATKACGPTCDGTRRDGCTYPAAGTPCVPASCQNDSLTNAGTCDGAGVCAPGATRDCGEYTCKNGACKTSCATNADCKPGGACAAASSTCRSEGATCADDWTVRAPDGTLASCGGYRCVASACQQQCASTSDCAPGNECHASGCVGTDGGGGGTGGSGGASPDGGIAGVRHALPAAQSSDGSACGCRVLAASHGSGRMAIVALTGLFASLARRRRATRCALARV